MPERGVPERKPRCPDASRRKGVGDKGKREKEIFVSNPSGAQAVVEGI